MTTSGIGQDGYMRMQEETTYGTAVSNSMTDLPVKSGSVIVPEWQHIDNPLSVASRLKQDPDAGRKVAGGQIMLNPNPDILGLIFQQFLGAASSSGPTDSTYTHTWLTPISGTNIGKSFTLDQALGADTVSRFEGGTITALKLSGDNSGNCVLTLDCVFEDWNAGVARASSWSYPTTIPFNFSMGSVSIDPISPDNDSAIAQLMDSWELSIDLGYDTERFKSGSALLKQPVFKTIPSVSFSCSVDAEQQWKDYADQQQTFSIDLTLTSSEYAGGTTAYSLVFEIPKAILKSDTSISGDHDLLKMNLDFDCSYGGTTTGSGSDSVAAEVRLVDATAAYS